MIAYVSFVAVTNLVLGMALARYLSNAGVHTAPANSRPQLDLPSTTDSLSLSDDKADVPDAIAEVGAAAMVDETVPSEIGIAVPADDDKPTLATLWSEFAAQLRDVSEKVQYCRVARDTALAQQAASRLKSFVKEWYTQFEECLQREQPDETTQQAAAGQSFGAVEMFAAQLETTLSNIDALDYTLPCDDVLDLLNRELETLDRQRRGFAKSAEAAK